VKAYTESARVKGFTMPKPLGYTDEEVETWRDAAVHGADARFLEPHEPEDHWQIPEDTQWPQGFD